MTLNVTIPDDLSPQQAWALYDILADFQQYVWDSYEQQLVTLIRFELQHDADGRDEDRHDDDDLDDPIPF